MKREFKQRENYVIKVDTELRVNEVCTIKGDAYYEMNGDTWIRLYQNKMKAEKTILIPATLYELMKGYIAKNGIEPDAYVFQNKNGGAFKIGTFVKQMKEKCTEQGISCGDYVFRSHDTDIQSVLRCIARVHPCKLSVISWVISQRK
ncbi:MAG: site-specific integrase [Lachnospiraceae bacterium]|nr:site-specific integrase [Lachnospiraceae bacterium]